MVRLWVMYFNHNDSDVHYISDIQHGCHTYEIKNTLSSLSALIRLMKDGLLGQHFLDCDTIIADVKKRIASIVDELCNVLKNLFV